MSLVNKEYKKAEKYEEKGDYLNAAICYSKGARETQDDYGIFHEYRLFIQHPEPMAKNNCTTCEKIVEIAIPFLLKFGDAGLELIAKYYIDNSHGLSTIERYNKVLECLDKMEDKDGSEYHYIVSEMAPLEEKAKQKLKEREDFINTRTPYEIKMGIERINKPGGFFSYIETHPYENLRDLKYGTNYYGRYVDNFYKSAYSANFVDTIDGWEFEIRSPNSSEYGQEDDVIYKDLYAVIKRVPLEGNGYSFSRHRDKLDYDYKDEIKEAFLNSRACQIAQEKFIQNIQKLYETKYASAYRLAVMISSATLDDIVYFDYYD